MLSQTIDITELWVTKEVKEILTKAEFNGQPLPNCDLKPQLINYILPRIRHCHFTLENVTEIPKHGSEILPQCPIEEKVLIRQYIYIGLYEIYKQLCSQHDPTTKSRSAK